MPKYRQIYDNILERISAGEFGDGTRLPSELELARSYNVSRPTVTRALNEMRIDGYLERRSGSGSYVRTPQGSVKDGTTSHKRFGLLVPRVGEIFEPIANRIAELAHELNFSLMWMGASADNEQSSQAFEQACRRYIEHGVDGVFLVTLELVPEANEINHNIMSLLDSSGVPAVLVDSDFQVFPQRSKFDLIGIDNIRNGYLAANHLLKQGVDRVDFFWRSYSASTVLSRIKGYRMALFDAGITADPSWIHEGDPEDTSFVKTAISNGASNIVCGNDETAAELMHTLTGLNIDIPKDVRVVGFDDVKYARLARVPLTTFRQPCKAIADLAVNTMFSRLSYPKRSAVTIFAAPQLIVRESSKIPTESRETKLDTSLL